uniref:Putative ovule protein n=1 Tax=Solanum chacoense TaxID=4108 RepID=A0A0V0HZJ2_SOLCH
MRNKKLRMKSGGVILTVIIDKAQIHHECTKKEMEKLKFQTLFFLHLKYFLFLFFFSFYFGVLCLVFISPLLSTDLNMSICFVNILLTKRNIT